MVDIDPSIIVDYLDQVEKWASLKRNVICGALGFPGTGIFRLCFPINPCCVHNCFDPAKFDQ